MLLTPMTKGPLSCPIEDMTICSTGHGYGLMGLGADLDGVRSGWTNLVLLDENLTYSKRSWVVWQSLVALYRHMHAPSIAMSLIAWPFGVEPILWSSQGTTWHGTMTLQQILCNTTNVIYSLQQAATCSLQHTVWNILLAIQFAIFTCNIKRDTSLTNY